MNTNDADSIRADCRGRPDLGRASGEENADACILLDQQRAVVAERASWIQYDAGPVVDDLSLQLLAAEANAASLGKDADIVVTNDRPTNNTRRSALLGQHAGPVSLDDCGNRVLGDFADLDFRIP